MDFTQRFSYARIAREEKTRWFQYLNLHMGSGVVVRSQRNGNPPQKNRSVLLEKFDF